MTHGGSDVISVARERHPWALAVGGAVAGLMLGGCGGADGKVGLPSSPPHTAVTSGATTATPTSQSSPPATPRDAVVAAYTQSFPAMDRALEAPPEQIRPILKDYATGWYLEFEIRQVVDEQAQHL